MLAPRRAAYASVRCATTECDPWLSMTRTGSGLGRGRREPAVERTRSASSRVSLLRSTTRGMLIAPDRSRGPEGAASNEDVDL